MFYLTGIVSLAWLCVVNAAFTINIYDRDSELAEASEVNRCDYFECGQMCRRLGYSGGMCVSGVCKCNNYLPSGDTNQLMNNEVDDVDEKINDCNPLACDQLCRRLKFPGGVCVNGRCKCDNFKAMNSRIIEKYPFLQTDEEITDNDIDKVDEVLSDCNPFACNQLCWRLQMHGGHCVNGLCKCFNVRRNERIEENNIDTGIMRHLNDPRDCNPSACNQLCWRLKFHGGVCVNGRCKCDNFKEIHANHPNLDEEWRALKKTSMDEDREEFKDCSVSACIVGCMDIGYPGGFCYDGTCECDPKDHAENKIRSLQTCSNVTCYFTCRRMNYMGGTCQNGRCFCF